MELKLKLYQLVIIKYDVINFASIYIRGIAILEPSLKVKPHNENVFRCPFHFTVPLPNEEIASSPHENSRRLRIKSPISKFTLNWTDNSENPQSTAASGRSKLQSSDFHWCKLPSKFHGKSVSKSVICMLYVSMKCT